MTLKHTDSTSLQLVKTTSTEISTQQGPNDKQVEAYRHGEMHNTYLSSLVVGDVFRFLDGSQTDIWYHVKEPVRKSSMRRSSHPSFSFGALEIVQAPSIESRIQKKKNYELESPRQKTRFHSTIARQFSNRH